MKCRWLFTRRSRASGHTKDDGDTVWLKLLGTLGTSTVLVCWTGVMAGSMAALLSGAPLMSSANTSAPQWLVLNSEDEWPS